MKNISYTPGWLLLKHRIKKFHADADWTLIKLAQWIFQNIPKEVSYTSPTLRKNQIFEIKIVSYNYNKAFYVIL